MMSIPMENHMMSIPMEIVIRGRGSAPTQLFILILRIDIVLGTGKRNGFYMPFQCNWIGYKTHERLGPNLGTRFMSQ